MYKRQFIPMLLGFGCNIPGVMACRTIEREEDRILTILVNPLMSCSARLPVYVLIGSAVLGAYAAAGVYSMYILGIVLAVCMALLFRRVIPYFRGRRSMFIMELPVYTRPTLRGLLTHMYERGVLFLKKAGMIIFSVMVVIWFLATHPWSATAGGEVIENSYICLLYTSPSPRD